MKKTTKQNKTVRGKAPEGFHFHKNGGGLVADTAHVSATAFIGPKAVVQDQAFVKDHAKLTGNTRISRYTFVGGDAVIHNQVLDHGIHNGTWA